MCDFLFTSVDHMTLLKNGYTLIKNIFFLKSFFCSFTVIKTGGQDKVSPHRIHITSILIHLKDDRIIKAEQNSEFF